MVTPQTQAIGLANQLISYTQQAAELSAQIDALHAQLTNISAFTLINAFPTIALDAMGGESGTSDVSPNVAHPVNINIFPGNQITRAISATDLAGLDTFLQGVSSAIKGSAVSANGAAVQLVAKTL
jgi:hypothetical protein